MGPPTRSPREGARRSQSGLASWPGGAQLELAAALGLASAAAGDLGSPGMGSWGQLRIPAWPCVRSWAPQPVSINAPYVGFGGSSTRLRPQVHGRPSGRGGHICWAPSLEGLPAGADGQQGECGASPTGRNAGRVVGLCSCGRGPAPPAPVAHGLACAFQTVRVGSAEASVGRARFRELDGAGACEASREGPGPRCSWPGHCWCRVHIPLGPGLERGVRLPSLAVCRVFKWKQMGGRWSLTGSWSGCRSADSPTRGLGMGCASVVGKAQKVGRLSLQWPRAVRGAWRGQTWTCTGRSGARPTVDAACLPSWPRRPHSWHVQACPGALPSVGTGEGLLGRRGSQDPASAPHALEGPGDRTSCL